MYFACSFIEMQFEVHCTFDPPNAVHPDWFIMLLSGDATTDALRLTKQWKQITILLMVSHTFDLKSAQFRILIVICIECMLVQATSIGSGQCIVGSVVHSVHFENLITIYCLFENILNARSQLSSLEGAWNLNVFNWSGGGGRVQLQRVSRARSTVQHSSQWLFTFPADDCSPDKLNCAKNAASKTISPCGNGFVLTLH